MVFGKTGVAEPAYKVLASLEHGLLHYEIRQYGPRFVAETYYTGDQRGGGGDANNNTPFQLLARYIGVFGNAHNEGNQKLAMTAPVAMKDDGSGTRMAMTAPVAIKPLQQQQQQQQSGELSQESTTSSTIPNRRVMQFFLPAEYQTLESIPKPTNDAVHIRAVPGATGAVYRFSGNMMDPAHHRPRALQLAAQLRHDGVARASDEYVAQNYEFWGYNPPFTLPMFRRNEIWVELDAASVDHLVNGVTCTTAN